MPKDPPAKTSQYEAVIFDFDGTLFDTADMHIETARTTLLEAGLAVSVEWLRSAPLSDPAELRRKLRSDFDWTPPFSDEEMLARGTRNWRTVITHAVPVPTVVDLARVAAVSSPVAVASSNDSKAISRALDRNGLGMLFSAVVGRGDVTHLKPAPDAFLLAAARLGVEPARCLAYENSDEGVTAALAAGMDVVDVRTMTVTTPERSSSTADQRDALSALPVAGHERGTDHGSGASVAEHDALIKALTFLADEKHGHDGYGAQLAVDPLFKQIIPRQEARSFLRERHGVEVGFDLGREASGAGLALAHVPPEADEGHALSARLAPWVHSARRGRRYCFFPDNPQFAADTDCTSVALMGLFTHGLLSEGELRVGIAQLLSSATPPGPSEPARDTDPDEWPGVFQVYWEDGEEPQAWPRGRKHDAVVCANILYTLDLSPAGVDSSDARVQATVAYLADHLTSGGFLSGTRYYPAPEACLHAVSRLCARSRYYARHLSTPLHDAFTSPGLQGIPDGENGPLNLALRIITADNLGLAHDQARQRTLLLAQQRPDGSWPACAYYRLGRLPFHFGSPVLTTAFAVAALHG
ncbi:HAD family hydrolase [Streptomyces alanosinicus]|uniref:HAD family hydrolase n=1 Tax=Streptomyces alanosinicus TaxID=68171 RepID=A0A918YKT8_9ACTN|nr:HAD family phosphatase [Streptomyces alanosinicus]GHE06556.1 hypothetical protein GCM10010339_47560 [Streptomyces alanosinicus]